MRARRLAEIGAALALALACSGGEEGTGASSSSGSSSSGASSSGSSGSSGAESTSDAASTGASSTGASSTGASSTGASSTGASSTGESTSGESTSGESTTEAEACDEAIFGGAGIFQGPFAVGDACDAVIVCTSDPAGVQALFPAATCEGAGYPCERGDRCQVGDAGEVSAEAWASYCAASLLPEVSAVKCVVWGP